VKLEIEFLGSRGAGGPEFEEGILKIGVSAFETSLELKNAAFPASLTAIEANAFRDCDDLREVTFAVGCQLQYIRGGPFSQCTLNKLVSPASIVEIDFSPFSNDVSSSNIAMSNSLAPILICSIKSQMSI
jgi:hypothetical protein